MLPRLWRHNCCGSSIRPGAIERRPPITEKTPGYARRSLGVCSWLHSLRRPEPAKARPAPDGGGPVHFSLDGRQSGGVPSRRGKRPHRWSSLVRRREGGFFPFSGVGVNARIFGWSRGPPLLSGRISITPACTFGLIDGLNAEREGFVLGFSPFSAVEFFSLVGKRVSPPVLPRPVCKTAPRYPLCTSSAVWPVPHP